MADLTTGVNEVAEQLAEDNPLAYDWTVAWVDETEEVICVKVAADVALVKVEPLVLALAEYGFHLGYAPGAKAPQAEYQFKRLE